MLDYQINEAILRAYFESVCGYKRHKNKKFNKNKVNEDNNVVASVSTPVSDVERAAELNRRAKLTPEEQEREDQQRRRWEEEYAKEQRQKAYENRPKTYMSAASERPDPNEGTISSRDDFNRAQMRAMQAADPGTRIGKGVYDGLGYMLPGAAVGGFRKGAKAAADISKAAFGKAYGALNRVNRNNFLYKIPIGVAASKGINVGVAKGADFIDAAGYEPEAKLMREASYWAPFIIAPTGSIARGILGPGLEYLQDRFGTSRTEDSVGKIQDLIGHESDYSQEQEVHDCDVCGYKAKTHEELLNHFEKNHYNK